MNTIEIDGIEVTAEELLTQIKAIQESRMELAPKIFKKRDHKIREINHEGFTKLKQEYFQLGKLEEKYRFFLNKLQYLKHEEQRKEYFRRQNQIHQERWTKKHVDV